MTWVRIWRIGRLCNVDSEKRLGEGGIGAMPMLLKSQSLDLENCVGTREIDLKCDFETDKLTGREFATIVKAKKAKGYLAIPTAIHGTSVIGINDFSFSCCSGLTGVTIPEGVTCIGERAFEQCHELLYVTIPSSVTIIGENAFFGCSGLKAFSVADDNPNYKSVSGLLLTKDGKTLICGVDGDVTIPDGVTNIEDSAFDSCRNLTSVTIPDGVTSIGPYAFSGCSGLKSVMIPDSVTSIGCKAFDGCRESLFDTTTIIGVKLLDGWAIGVSVRLSGDLKLTGVCGVGDEAFDDCSKLTSVIIPSSVTHIGKDAFSSGSGIKSFSVAEDNPNYKSVSGLLLTKDGKTLMRGVDGDVTIPDGVTNIEDSAFDSCRNLTSVTIPDGVTSIGPYAFSGCSGLKSVMIPDSVTSIGEGAFAGCSGLMGVTIPARVMCIGEGAFDGCSCLNTFSVAEDNPNFKSEAGLLLTKDGKALIRGVNGDVVIPAGVVHIEAYAFSGCNSLTSVTIPASVASVGDPSFSDCSGLNVFSVDADNPNFKSVSGLLLTKDGRTLVCGVNGDVTIPNGVTGILAGAFSGRSSLTSVTIPDSVTSLGDSISNPCFGGCGGLRVYSVAADNPNYKSVSGLLLTKDGKTLIGGVNGDVVIPSGVTNIGDNAFRDCYGLTSVMILDSVENIGMFAFAGCRELMCVQIHNSVACIGKFAFVGCSGLVSVTIPASVTSIGDGAFVDCDELKDFSVEEDNPNYKSVSGLLLTKDGRTLVRGVNGDVVIPSTVTSVGWRAFSGFSGLKSVTIPDSVMHIGNDAFDETSLETVYVSLGDVDRIKKLFLDSGYDIKNVKFLEAKAEDDRIKEKKL